MKIKASHGIIRLTFGLTQDLCYCTAQTLPESSLHLYTFNLQEDRVQLFSLRLLCNSILLSLLSSEHKLREHKI